MHSLKEVYLKVVYKIHKYFKGSSDKGLFFKKSEANIEVFTYINWIGSVEYRKSTTRYFNFVFGNSVTWRSKKQNIMAMNSVDAEFREMTHGICKAL